MQGAEGTSIPLAENPNAASLPSLVSREKENKRKLLNLVITLSHLFLSMLPITNRHFSSPETFRNNISSSAALRRSTGNRSDKHGCTMGTKAQWG